MAALGATGMFLGGESAWGGDLGPVGAAVLYAALWVFVVHLARHAGEVFPEEWSSAEKQAWVTLVFVALICFQVISTLAVLPELGADADRLGNSATRNLGIRIAMPVFGWIVVTSMLARQEPGAVRLDERDLRIAHAASRFADGGTTLFIIGLVVTLVVLPEYSRTWLRPLIAANVLIALLIARALVENMYSVLRYRRERG
ncbi:MAG TPA: hypothetical protein VFZ95_10700 [Steroidobacteraceae bacterium]